MIYFVKDACRPDLRNCRQTRKQTCHEKLQIKLLSIVLRHAAEQDAALGELQKICSEDKFNQYKRMVGKSMGTMLLEIIIPLLRSIQI